MANETWIVYKTEEMNYPGWEERMLMPRESPTDILEENMAETDYFVGFLGSDRSLCV